jgi:uncharacterized cupin superfamily protein
MARVYTRRNLDPKKTQRGKPHVVFAARDVPRTEWFAGEKCGGVLRRLGEFGRSKRIGVNLREIPPGKWSGTFHWHTHEEEHFYFLEGTGVFRIGNTRQKVKAGSYVVFPPNGKAGHAVRNTGRGPLKYLVIGTRESGDVCVYPDSGKLALNALDKVGRLAQADYWDGEV